MTAVTAKITYDLYAICYNAGIIFIYQSNLINYVSNAKK